jgi:threonine dehydrogenase-like Zn-dependent dehydrogenase
VAIHGSKRAAPKPGSTLLVFGAGAVGLLCAAMANVCGAKTVVIADIQAERVDFAVKNKFADAKIVVPMKRPEGIEAKLAFAKDVAEMAKTASGVGEVDAVFECTGVESWLQTAIYVRDHALRCKFKLILTVNETWWAYYVHRDGKSHSDTSHLGGCIARDRPHRRLQIRKHL